jgi:hypothetical protein
VDNRRRLATALGLLGAFLIAVAAGGWLARQSHGGPVVAVVPPPPSSPAPPLVVVSASVASATAAASVVDIASPSPFPLTSPSIAASVTPSVTPSASTVPGASVDPATAAQFAADLLVALQTGDTTYLNERIDPAVVDRYGASQCMAHIDAFKPDPTASWTVVSSSGPQPWPWMSDGLTTQIPDAWTVSVNDAASGQRDLHFAPADGTWRWFVDCGKPA